MNNMISAMVKRPGEPPRHVNISNNLEALQKNVEGYIETFTLADDLVIICNEEGRLMGLQDNCRICDEDFVGTILIVGIEGEEFADLPCGWNMLKKMFPLLWLAPWFDGRFHAAKEVD